MKWLLRPFRRLILKSKLASVAAAEAEAKSLIANCWRERDRLQSQLRAL